MSPRYLKITCFNGDFFCFFGMPCTMRTVQHELLQFALRVHDHNERELIKETTGTEDFDFYQIEPPHDRLKAVTQLTEKTENSSNVFTRKAVLYHRKAKIRRQTTGLE